MINLHYLKKQRENRLYSQTYMAKQLGYTNRSAYYQIEKGKRKLTLQTFLKIVKILDLDLTTAIAEVSNGGAE